LDNNETPNYASTRKDACMTHEYRALVCGKASILPLSMHAIFLPFLVQIPIAFISCRNGTLHDTIETSPIHLEYTTHMYGVDVMD